MSEDQKFARLLQQYNSFEADFRSSTPHVADHSTSSSARGPVYLTVEPSEARGIVPNFSTLLTARSKQSSATAAGNTLALSSASSNSRRSGRALFDDYFEFSNSLEKTRRVLLRSVATEKELRMADVHLWRRSTRSAVTIEAPSSSTSLLSTQTSLIELLRSKASPSTTIDVKKNDAIVKQIANISSQSSSASSPSSISASSPSCCSSDSESSSASSTSYASEGDESDEEASNVPQSWPATCTMMCSLETSQCAIASDLELPPQNCCV